MLRILQVLVFPPKLQTLFLLRLAQVNKAGSNKPICPFNSVTQDLFFNCCFQWHGLSSGTNEIVVDVDDDGVISLIFECSEMTESSQFVWSKNYKAFTDTSRLTIETVKGKWVSAILYKFLLFFFHTLCCLSDRFFANKIYSPFVLWRKVWSHGRGRQLTVSISRWTMLRGC